MAYNIQLSANNGEYSIVMDENGVKAKRYGAEWRDLTGDNLFLSLILEIAALKGLVKDDGMMF